MPNIKSSKKRVKIAKRNHDRNVARRSEMKTYTRRVLEALEANDVEAARAHFKAAESKIAKATNKGVIKKNTASRKISRLAQRIITVAAIQQTTQQ